jgi:hypothetical protein
MISKTAECHPERIFVLAYKFNICNGKDAEGTIHLNSSMYFWTGYNG